MNKNAYKKSSSLWIIWSTAMIISIIRQNNPLGEKPNKWCKMVFTCVSTVQNALKNMAKEKDSHPLLGLWALNSILKNSMPDTKFQICLSLSLKFIGCDVKNAELTDRHKFTTASWRRFRTDSVRSFHKF